MFRKIVIGYDGLEGGADALAFAEAIASEGTELVLLHAYPFEPHPLAMERNVQLHRDAEKLLSAVGPLRHASTRLPIGDLSPARALHRTAQEEQADLIAIGSCRRGALGRVLLGDVSRSTLHGAPCPVAIAPRGFRRAAEIDDTIGVGFNGTESAGAALRLAGDIAQARGARLRILTAAPTPMPSAPRHVYSHEPPAAGERRRLEAEQLASRAASAQEVPASAEVVDAAPGRALTELSRHVGLLIAGSRGWGAAHRVLLGSTTDHLVHHAACPIVVVPGPALTATAGNGAPAEVTLV